MTVDIPINNGALFKSENILLCGGGGSTKSGIKNKAILMDLEGVVKEEIILEKEHDSIMSIHSVDDYMVFCANDSKSNLKQQVNNDIRVYKYNKEFKLQWTGQAVFNPPTEYVRVVKISPNKEYILCGTTEKTIIATKLHQYTPLKGDLPDEVYDIDFIDESIAIVTMPSQIAIIDIKPDRIENLFILPLPSYSGSKAAPIYRCSRLVQHKDKLRLLIVTNIGRSQGYLSWFDVKKEETIREIKDESNKENNRRKSIATTNWKFKFIKTKCVSRESIRNIAISSSRELVACALGQEILILDYNFTILYKYTKHTFPASVLLFIKNGEQLVSSGADQTFHIEHLTPKKLRYDMIKVYVLLFLLISGLSFYFVYLQFITDENKEL